MKQGSSGKIANTLVAASWAAVLTVYAAGYVRTRSAADQFEAQAGQRRAPAPPPTVVANTPARPAQPEGSGSSSTAPSASPIQRPADKPTEILRSDSAPSAVIVSPESSPIPPVKEPVMIANQAPEPVVVAALAAAPVPAASIAAPPAPVWKDGTYTGWGYSRHGNLEAAVVVEHGRITSAYITQCLTRYSCSIIDAIIPQVVQRQSPDVDVVSGATQSADAFYGAVVEALSKAK